MQVNLFDTIQTSRKIVYNSVFVTLAAFVDMSSVLIWRLKNEQWVVATLFIIESRTLERPPE
jgi:hypothetical protein